MYFAESETERVEVTEAVLRRVKHRRKEQAVFLEW